MFSRWSALLLLGAVLLSSGCCHRKCFWRKHCWGGCPTIVPAAYAPACAPACPPPCAPVCPCPCGP